MLDPKKSAEYEQSMALVSEHLPRLWASMYGNCLEAGLTPELATTFMQTYILASNSNRVFGISAENGPEQPDKSD